MAETGLPPLYDEARGLRELARARMKRDRLTRAQVAAADDLAAEVLRYFSAGEAETAGRALLIASACAGALAADGLPAAAIVNVLGFAAGRMVADGRAWTSAQDGPA